MGRIREIQRSGFTLLEILVAMFILAIVISTIFGTFSETLKNINHAESQADIYQMARVALKIMNEDLEGSLISGTRNFSGQDEEIDGRDADFLSFFPRIIFPLKSRVQIREMPGSPFMFWKKMKNKKKKKKALSCIERTSWSGIRRLKKKQEGPSCVRVFIPLISCTTIQMVMSMIAGTLQTGNTRTNCLQW